MVIYKRRAVWTWTLTVSITCETGGTMYWMQLLTEECSVVSWGTCTTLATLQHP